jgi:hypothetical protein
MFKKFISHCDSANRASPGLAQVHKSANSSVHEGNTASLAPTALLSPESPPPEGFLGKYVLPVPPMPTATPGGRVCAVAAPVEEEEDEEEEDEEEEDEEEEELLGAESALVLEPSISLSSPSKDCASLFDLSLSM